MKVEVRQQPVTVPGFRFAGVACGLKTSGKRDVALIVSDQPAAAAAAFTTNRVKAAPVIVGQQRLRRGRVQAVLINSGNANAYTGRDGERLARELTARVAAGLGIAAELVVPSSTGRIGVPLPRARVRRGVDAALAALSADGFHDALEGIMTTDAFPKFAVERLRLGRHPVTIAAMAKGAGMIAPNMATLLVYILTDARVARGALVRALRAGLPGSFNAIVVDGDMSTNDTVLLLANGAAGNPTIGVGSPGFAPFAAAVGGLMARLARAIVKDGEGATKVVDIVVRGARSDRDAAKVADAIARSPLCKTAFYGGDPYAGRIVCAAGYSGAAFDPARLDVYLDDVAVVRRGIEVVGRVERRASRIAAKPEFALTLDLHAGKGTALRIASDLTVDYVRFNSDYRT
jgi:glutamate N-acetyltransferase/amino-acid N-acetyltransferase